MNLALEKRVCLITGSDEGLGAALVEGFLKREASVAAGLLKKDEFQTTAPNLLPLQMDVTADHQVREAVEACVQRFGRLDVLINNAGIYPRKPVDELTFEDWRQLMNINLDGTFRCCQAAIPHFKKQQGGNIINVGSICMLTAHTDLVPYRTSKAAILGLTRGLARDLGRFGVRVNCLAPGAVETEGERRIAPDPQEVLDLVNEKQCIPGRITPQSVEPVFAFLASDASQDITGQCITVDRGWAHY